MVHAGRAVLTVSAPLLGQARRLGCRTDPLASPRSPAGSARAGRARQGSNPGRRGLVGPWRMTPLSTGACACAPPHRRTKAIHSHHACASPHFRRVPMGPPSARSRPRRYPMRWQQAASQWGPRLLPDALRRSGWASGSRLRCMPVCTEACMGGQPRGNGPPMHAAVHGPSMGMGRPWPHGSWAIIGRAWDTEIVGGSWQRCWQGGSMGHGDTGTRLGPSAPCDTRGRAEGNGPRIHATREWSK